MVFRDRDRERLAFELGYEVQFLVEKTGFSADQARELIKRHGNDRATLVREARRLGLLEE